MFYAFTLSAEAPVFFNLFPGAKGANCGMQFKWIPDNK